MTHKAEHDRIFSDYQSEVAPFRFDTQVAQVFDDMVQRSVPAYWECQQRQAQLASHFYQPATWIYDLGCSHGNFIQALQQSLPADRPWRLQAVDSCYPLLQRLEQRLHPSLQQRVHIQCCPLQEVIPSNASVVVLHLTLQFLPLEQRRPLLERIFAGLHPGGALLLTEKTRHPQPDIEQLQTQIYHQFKQEQGYSELEIAQKRRSLEGVLQPETPQTHQLRLEQIGFYPVSYWWQWLQFQSFLAVKPQQP